MRVSLQPRLLSILVYASAAHCADQPALSCSPDIPVVQMGDTVTIRAFTPAAAPRFTWSATAGSVAGSSADARWTLSNAPPGIYRATVQLDGSGKASTCSMRLVVVEKLRGGVSQPAIESGSAFLLPGQMEGSGFGLYSYLLLGAPPVDSTRDRYLQVINAYLNLMPALAQLKENIRPKDLNATYLLLTAEPPKKITADWVLRNYDFARARSLLRFLPGQLRVGPYFVSSTNPLMGATEIARPYLFQDMSSIPPTSKDLATWWVREFMNQAAQQRFWDSRNGEEFALRLRTTLAVLGTGLPDVRESLKEWVSWIS